MILTLLLACQTPAARDAQENPRCGSYYRPYTDDSCECRPSAAVLVDVPQVYCRPDQDLRIEWEPSATAGRTEDEDRVGGVAICECRGRP